MKKPIKVKKNSKKSQAKSVYKIRFEDLEKAEAGKHAQELISHLGPIRGAKIKLNRDDPTSQDFGATLVLVLGTPAIIALSRGIAAYLKMRRIRIVIDDANGKVIAEGLGGDDASARIAEALAKRR